MKICVVGLGEMGRTIADRLIGTGHTVSVWDRSAVATDGLTQKGARELSSLDQAWESDVCITVLPDSAALAEVTMGRDGLVRAERGRGKFLIDMTTTSAESSRRIAVAAERSGIKFLRAPISDEPGAVHAGNLTIVVSGEQCDCVAMEGLLRDIGSHVFRSGDGESARIVNLALHLMIAGTAELLAESLAVAEAHGVNRSKMLQIVAASAAGSPFIKYKLGQLLCDNFASTFSTSLMLKDVDMILSAAADGGVALPVAGVVEQRLQDCITTGLGELDFTSLLVRLKQEAAPAHSASAGPTADA